MNIRIAFSILLLTGITSLVGCSTTPWDAVKDYAEESHPPKAITDDVQAFILSKKIPSSDISEIRYGVDGTGRRAVRISQEIPASLGQATLEHVLYYDKNNVRTRVLLLHGRRSC